MGNFANRAFLISFLILVLLTWYSGMLVDGDEESYMHSVKLTEQEAKKELKYYSEDKTYFRNTEGVRIKERTKIPFVYETTTKTKKVKFTSLPKK